MADGGKILCMYSGGLDSIGCLHALLTDDAYAGFGVHVHHMHLVNVEARALAEKRAARASIEEFRSLGARRFTYTESGHNYSFLQRRFIWDMDISAFMAANIAIADPTIVQVAMGRTGTDVDGGGSDFQRRMQRAQRVFDAVWSLEDRQRPVYIFPVVAHSKAEIWRRLPASLRELAWSCRRPRYEGDTPVACGKCRTCRDIARMHTELESQA